MGKGSDKIADEPSAEAKEKSPKRRQANKVIEDKLIGNKAYRKLLHRAGIERVQAATLKIVTERFKEELTSVLIGALQYTDARQKKTITTPDIKAALRDLGHVICGIDKD